MVKFKYLDERQCNWCSRDYIPGDPEWPEATTKFCCKKCAEDEQEANYNTTLNKSRDKGFRPVEERKRHGKIRGEHYLETYVKRVTKSRNKRKRKSLNKSRE